MRLTNPLNTPGRKVAGVAGVLALGAAVSTAWIPLGTANASPAPVKPAVSLRAGAWQQTAVGFDKGDITAVTALSDTDAYAVGYRMDGATPTALALHWDGTAWSQHSTLPANSWPQTIAVRAANDIWAGGQGLVHWNGTAWTNVRPGQDPGGNFLPETLANGPDGTVFAVGRALTRNVKTGVPAIQVWNGTAWTAQTLPSVGNGELDNVVAVAANDVWAVGVAYSTSATAPATSLVFHYDGTSWTRVTSPSAGATSNTWLSGITALAANDVWAVGGSTVSGVDRPFAVHWDGKAWAVAPTPNVADGRLRSVSRRANGELWAVGGKGSVSTALTFNRTTKQWVKAPAPEAVTRVFTTVPGSKTLWAVGLAKQGDLVPTIVRYQK